MQRVRQRFVWVMHACLLRPPKLGATWSEGQRRTPACSGQLLQTCSQISRPRRLRHSPQGSMPVFASPHADALLLVLAALAGQLQDAPQTSPQAHQDPEMQAHCSSHLPQFRFHTPAAPEWPTAVPPDAPGDRDPALKEPLVSSPSRQHACVATPGQDAFLLVVLAALAGQLLQDGSQVSPRCTRLRPSPGGAPPKAACSSHPKEGGMEGRTEPRTPACSCRPCRPAAPDTHIPPPRCSRSPRRSPQAGSVPVGMVRPKSLSSRPPGQGALLLVLAALAGQLLQDGPRLLAGKQLVHAQEGVRQGLPHLAPLEALQLRQLRSLGTRSAESRQQGCALGPVDGGGVRLHRPWRWRRGRCLAAGARAVWPATASSPTLGSLGRCGVQMGWRMCACLMAAEGCWQGAHALG